MKKSHKEIIEEAERNLQLIKEKQKKEMQIAKAKYRKEMQAVKAKVDKNTLALGKKTILFLEGKIEKQELEALAKELLLITQDEETTGATND